MLTKIEIDAYDNIIVAFSGGKDSIACFLHLLDLGIGKEKIELWHHDIDGQEGSELMDWSCTRDYCRKFAAAFGVKIYFSWKKGGFEGEMTRVDCPTQAIMFETPGGLATTGGVSNKKNTRMKFPQVTADLSVRWCSAYLKIDVMAAAIRAQVRFKGCRTLVLTGERAEESSNRAKYKVFEPHRADPRSSDAMQLIGLARSLKKEEITQADHDEAATKIARRAAKRLDADRRHVDQWRAVHVWEEKAVWDILEKYLVNPHPAYRLGWGRVSCAACIFGSPSQWASLKEVSPKQFDRVAAYEAQFGATIQRKLSVHELAAKGKAYPEMADSDKEAATARLFQEPIIVQAGEWRLPKGAFGESCGPV